MKDSKIRFTIISIWILGAAALAGCSPQGTGGRPAAGTEKRASATIAPKGDSGLTGTAVFNQIGGEVVFRLEVENAPPGTHAVHLHQFGDCSSPDAKSAGGHWNPGSVDHGRWGTEPFHLGDIGNMEVGENGRGTFTLTTDLWTIGGAEGSNVVGRALIVHSGVDDYVSQPTGNAGSRIGCGVIQPED